MWCVRHATVGLPDDARGSRVFVALMGLLFKLSHLDVVPTQSFPQDALPQMLFPMAVLPRKLADSNQVLAVVGDETEVSAHLASIVPRASPVVVLRRCLRLWRT